VTGAKYFLTIVDDFTMSTWTHQMLQDKTQLVSTVKAFILSLKLNLMSKFLWSGLTMALSSYTLFALIFPFQRDFTSKIHSKNPLAKWDCRKKA